MRADWWKAMADYRKKAGMTQEAAAGTIGKSRKWLSQVESGASPLRMHEGIALLTLYGQTWQTAFADSDNSGMTDRILTMQRKGVEMQMAKLLPRMTTNQMKGLLAVAIVLATQTRETG